MSSCLDECAPESVIYWYHFPHFPFVEGFRIIFFIYLIVVLPFFRLILSQMTEEKWSFFHSSRAHVHRSSCAATEVERLSALLQKKIGQSILGKVKLQSRPVPSHRLWILLYLLVRLVKDAITKRFCGICHLRKHSLR